MLSHTCPCCSDTLLRHIRTGEVYWFCRHCYQEMPDFVNEFPKNHSMKALESALKTNIDLGLPKAAALV